MKRRGMLTLECIGKNDIENHHANVYYRVLECKESGNLIVKGDTKGSTIILCKQSKD